MQGYSTGWKFNGWWNGVADVGSATNNGVYTNAQSGVNGGFVQASWAGQITNDPQTTYAISVHGYNAIRLRFPMSTVDAAGGALTYPVTWNVYLIDSDAEPDQTPSIWMSSLYCTVMTTWPITTSIPTGSSSSWTDYLNIYGRSWIRLANGVRIVQGQTAVGDLRELPTTAGLSSNAASTYIGNTYAGALGSYSNLLSHEITVATGAPVAQIYSDVAICPTYSPVLGTTNTTQAGEMYINNLAGSQYLLCVPIYGWGYQPASTKYTAPSTGLAGKAKSVGVMYNLIQ
jgi:hypothetical protein